MPHIRVMDIAKTIDDAMKRTGMSQSELERRSGVSQATLSRTLSGKTVPETNTLKKIFAVLGMDYAQLLNDAQPVITQKDVTFPSGTVGIPPQSVIIDLPSECLTVWNNLQQLSERDRERFMLLIAQAAVDAKLKRLDELPEKHETKKQSVA